MIHRYCKNVIPARNDGYEDGNIRQRMAELLPAVKARMTQSYQFSLALRDIWDLISLTNKYIATREPWALAKDPSRKQELDAVLYLSADVLRLVAGLIEPVMPDATSRVRKMLGIESENWEQLATSRL